VLALGSAAPEITVNIVVTIKAATQAAGDDGDPAALGTSAIIGSGYIGFLVIPAICALASSKKLGLARRPLFRDIAFYTIALSILLWISHDGLIVWYEAGILFSVYFVYIATVFLSPLLRRQVRLWRAHRRGGKEEVTKLRRKLRTQKSFVASARDAEDIANVLNAELLADEINAENENLFSARGEDEEAGVGGDGSSSSSLMSNGDPHSEDDSRQSRLSTIVDSVVTGLLASDDDDDDEYSSEDGDEDDAAKEVVRTRAVSVVSLAAVGKTPKGDVRICCKSGKCCKKSRVDGFSSLSSPSLNSLTPLIDGANTKSDDGGDADDEEEEKKAWYEKMEDIISWPFDFFFKWTHPNPESRKLWPLTLILSFAWVALLSFVISTVVTRWVTVSHVPAAFVGLILVSVGAEIPDTIASVTVAKRGYGSLATSNCMASQITNIALGLGLPWTISNLVGRPVPVTAHKEIQNGAFIQLANILLVFILLIGITIVRRQKKAQLVKWKAVILLLAYPLCLAGYACFVFIPALGKY
jgi:Ca2+/Na+ antiporter